MESKVLSVAQLPNFVSSILRRHHHHQQLPCLPSRTFQQHSNSNINAYTLRFHRCFSASAFNNSTFATASSTSRNGVYTVGDFMTKKEDLVVVKPSTTVDEAIETLVEYRITGFPVINDDWDLVGVVSDYDLLALDSVSGSGLTETSIFPEVDSSWKVFNEIQILLSKTNGKLVSDVMTPVPVVVCETTDLEDAARLLLETRYRRLPVVNAEKKLVGIITRGNVIRAALQIKRRNEKKAQ